MLGNTWNSAQVWAKSQWLKAERRRSLERHRVSRVFNYAGLMNGSQIRENGAPVSPTWIVLFVVMLGWSTWPALDGCTLCIASRASLQHAVLPSVELCLINDLLGDNGLSNDRRQYADCRLCHMISQVVRALCPMAVLTAGRTGRRLAAGLSLRIWDLMMHRV